MLTYLIEVITMQDVKKLDMDSIYNNRYYVIWALGWLLTIFIIERYVYSPTNTLILVIGLIFIASIVIGGWIPIYKKYLMNIST